MSSPLSQVIPAGQDAGFDITFCSQSNKTFTGPITYYINDRPFNFLVQAQADPVVLEIQKKVLRFEFSDDTTDMSVTETFIITNNGNANAKYKWVVPQNRAFVPEPLNDFVPAGGFKKVVVTFRPTGQKSEMDTLLLSIEDGHPVEVKCEGIVNEARCNFIEKHLDFGSVPVGLKANDQSLHIKNQMRTTAIFHVDHNCPELTITPMKGRIGADQK